MQQSTMSQSFKMLNRKKLLPDLIVFSHLRWEFVKQRPQHLVERLSHYNRVLFVEEPIVYTDDNYCGANLIDVNHNIVVVQPRIEWGDFRALSRVIETYTHLNSDKPIIWFYSAGFLPILNYLEYSLLVYDCMDELTAFKGAPKELLVMEKELLSIADVVFAGGKSLYEAKRKYNQNAHCFPSSVERKHFEKAFSQTTRIPSDIARLTKPIVGFYGVIDERMDLKLLRKVAQLTPEVDFVMIGPVAKIQKEDLPQANNIHYLGAKSYDVLPSYLKAFQIAMMPFALNKSTEFISPTKTLEFMAAQKPIISTPIIDIKRDFIKEVSLVTSASEFSQAVRNYLKETPAERTRRKQLQKAVVHRTSWDSTVQEMRELMISALPKNQYQSVFDSVANQQFGLQLQLTQ